MKPIKIKPIIKRCPCCNRIKIDVGLHNESTVEQCAECYFTSQELGFEELVIGGQNADGT